MSRHPRLMNVLTVLFVVMLLTACSGPLAGEFPPASVPAPDGREEGTSTLAFVPNVGQLDPALRFSTLGAAGALLFTVGEVLLPFTATTGEAAVLRVRFEGASDAAQVVGDEALPGVVNYYYGDDPAAWRVGVPTYGGIRYEDLYPGIDLVYHGSRAALKGTWVLAPGARPADIRWRYEGANSDGEGAVLELSDGELRITPAGNSRGAVPMIERAPVAWQMIGSGTDLRRRPVTVRYVVERDGTAVGFDVGRYDATLPLFIDPTLDYGTYFGGGEDEGAIDMALDGQGKIYIAGGPSRPTIHRQRLTKATSTSQ